ncbi:MAG: DUF4358 domain-containing protein [Clostridia bacterium]|nr:DUF4358 domain-containing protein [Clostridia bacterium]
MKKLLCLFFAVLIAAGLCACAKNDEPFDAEKAYARIISEVRFEDELRDMTDYAAFVFGDAAEGAEVRMLNADDKYEDAVIMFILKDASDAGRAEEAIRAYISERKTEASRYNPEEVTKLEKAVIYTNDIYVFCVISNDASTASKILGQ